MSSEEEVERKQNKLQSRKGFDEKTCQGELTYQKNLTRLKLFFSRSRWRSVSTNFNMLRLACRDHLNCLYASFGTIKYKRSRVTSCLERIIEGTNNPNSSQSYLSQYLAHWRKLPVSTGDIVRPHDVQRRTQRAEATYVHCWRGENSPRDPRGMQQKVASRLRGSRNAMRATGTSAHADLSTQYWEKTSYIPVWMQIC